MYIAVTPEIRNTLHLYTNTRVTHTNTTRVTLAARLLAYSTSEELIIPKISGSVSSGCVSRTLLADNVNNTSGENQFHLAASD